jgi:hypothetical protein
MPPFVAFLKRYRSILAGIHELTPPDAQNPLAIDDWASAADISPVEVKVFFLILHARVTTEIAWCLCSYCISDCSTRVLKALPGCC